METNKNEQIENGYWQIGNTYFRVHDNGTEYATMQYENEYDCELKFSRYRWSKTYAIESTEKKFLAAKKAVLEVLSADIQSQLTPFYIEGLVSYQKLLNNKAKSHLRHKRWGLALEKLEKINELQKQIDKCDRKN
jgi:hypothetical protein